MKPLKLIISKLVRLLVLKWVRCCLLFLLNAEAVNLCNVGAQRHLYGSAGCVLVCCRPYAPGQLHRYS